MKKEKIKESKKTLDEKQLLSSIADLMIRNREYARDLFKEEEDVLFLYPELTVFKDYMLSYENKNHIEEMSVIINEISHTETKAIFHFAFKSYCFENRL